MFGVGENIDNTGLLGTIYIDHRYGCLGVDSRTVPFPCTAASVLDGEILSIGVGINLAGGVCILPASCLVGLHLGQHLDR